MKYFASKRKCSLLFKTAFNLCFGIVTLMTAQSSYSIEFPDRPLLTSASVEPNVMLLIDSSFSMSSIVAGNFDERFDYADCPASITIPPIQLDETYIPNIPNIEVFLDGQSRVFFSYNGVEFDWGVVPGLGATGRQTRCFRDERIPSIRNPNPSYNITYSTDGNSAIEGGNFWNFYFSNQDQSSSDIFEDGIEKTGVGTRIDVAEEAANLLVRNLTGVRLGLSKFSTITNATNPNTGAEILQPILPLDNLDSESTSHRQNILDSLSGINVRGFTPVAEAVLDIGRYFIEGYEDQLITIHPNSENEQVIRAEEILSAVPSYAEGVLPPNQDNPIIEEFCQSNFIVALTDGQPNELALLNRFIVGGNAVGDDFRGYSDLESIDDENDVNSIRFAGNGERLVNSGVLDDVTLALQEIDLRPDLNNLRGENVRNGIETYYVAGFDQNLASNRELLEAANNGVEGEGQVYSALDADELILAFDEIFGEIVSSQGSFSTAAFSSGAITDSTSIFQSSFRFSGNLWSGDLRSFDLDNSSIDNVVSTFEADSNWSAAELLTRRLEQFGHEDRNIYTMSEVGVLSSSVARDGISFEFSSFEGSLFTANQIDDLSADDTDNIEEVINYIRGENNPLFRDRLSGEFEVLGDIVNSSPIVVGSPNLGFPDFSVSANVPFGSSALGGNYSDFANRFSNRQSVVYVGANDGMLHGFDSETGDELFAYIPSQVFDGESTQEGLYYLTDRNYQHKFYVDGNQAASDVFIDPVGGNSPQWRTVLVGGLRSGGKGLYALDVTDPSNLSASDADDVVLWEFDDHFGDEDMGHIFATPQIALMNNGEFAVVVGNGYNSTNGEAKLFIVFIEAGADGRWAPSDYVELSTNNDSDNGLSEPALVDLDGDRVIDRVYAGDIRGNMWAFDVSSRNTNDWSTVGNRPLFSTSRDRGVGNDNRQAITTAPLIARNGDTNTVGNEPNLLVFFGSGRILEADDLPRVETQSFYAVWDRGDNRLDRRDLHERRLVVSNDGLTRMQDTQSPFGDPIEWFSENTNLAEYGWFIDLPVEGERVVTEATLLSGIIFFSSSVPSTSVCSAGGTGFINAVGVDGLATRTPIIDFNDDGVINDDDRGFLSQAIVNGVPNGSAFIGSPSANTPCDSNGYLQAYSTSDGSVSFQAVCPENATGLGRRAWLEIFNN